MGCSFVIEPSMGVDRGVLAVMTEAYEEEDLGGGNSRIVLKLKKHLAPIKVAVIPLKKNNEAIMNKCHEIKQNLLKLGIGRVALENTGNIGKAYRRMMRSEPRSVSRSILKPSKISRKA